jgi:hypothetical protein
MYSNAAAAATISMTFIDRYVPVEFHLYDWLVYAADGIGIECQRY